MLDDTVSTLTDAQQGAFDWAKSFYNYDTYKVLSQTSHALTAVLVKGQDGVWLRVLNDSQPGALDAWRNAPSLAKDLAPQVLSVSTEHAAIVYKHEPLDRPLAVEDGTLFEAVRRLAMMQAKATSMQHLVPDAATCDAAELITTLTAKPAQAFTKTLGEARSAALSTVLTASREALSTWLRGAEALPKTLTTLALRSECIGVGKKNGLIVTDWDHPLWAPAGAGLAGLIMDHNALGNGLTAEGKYDGSKARDRDGALIEGFAKVLIENGYGSEDMVRRGLVQSIVLGAMAELVAYRPPHSADMLDIEQAYVGKLADIILHGCVLAASLDVAQAKSVAECLSRLQENKVLAILLYRVQVIHRLPVEMLASEDAEIDNNIERVKSLNRAMVTAMHPAICPQISADKAFTSTPQHMEEMADIGASMFREHGCLAIEDVFSHDLVAELCSFWKEHGGGAQGKVQDVGDKRTCEAVSIRGPFNQPAVYAAPALMEVLKRVLGGDMILNWFALVNAKPGAEVQHLHIDYPELFEELKFQPNLPCYSVGLLIPLVDVDEKVGGTKMIKGSHLAYGDEATKGKPFAPARLKRGGVSLFDFRTYHQGEANQSDIERPMFCMVYSRPWFRDTSDAHFQQPVQMPANLLREVPEEYKMMFRNAWPIEAYHG